MRRAPVVLALLGVWSAFWIAAGCSSDDRLPALRPGPEQGAGGRQEQPPGTGGGPACTSGASRACHVTLSEHDGVLACYHGTELCTDGRWGECRDGAVELLRSEDVQPVAPSGLLALDASMPCRDAGIDNKCDPNCHTYPGEIAPDGGYTTRPFGPVFSYTGGSFTGLPAALVDKAISQPCRSAYDCQVDRRCVNPSSQGCAHSVCSEGVALAANCDDVGTLGNKPGCVQQVCAEDPFCCVPATSGCVHSPCQTGGPLSSSCNACVSAVCAQEPSCCNTKWTQSCVNRVNSLSACSAIDCPCPSGQTMSHDGTRCYALRGTSTPRSWTSARSECNDLSGVDDDWHLATVLTPEDNAIVAAMLTSGGSAWIGLNDRSNEGSYTWIDTGLGLGSYRNWASGQPDNSGNEDCVEVVAWDADAYGRWNDRACGDNRQFVCEGPAQRSWDDDCVERAEAVCNVSCNVSGQGAGQCAPWQPGQFEDEYCSDDFDFTLGVPCDNGVLVCNRGADDAPAGRPIRYFSGTNSNQFPRSNPNTSGWTSTCTTPALAPGQCATVTGCTSGTGSGELVVNPGGSGECSAKNNWSVRPSGAVACSTPQVCEQGTLTGGSGASCTYNLTNRGNFDRLGGTVLLQPGSTALQRRDGSASCSLSEGGWYFNDPLNPSRVTLCPTSCTALRASAANSVTFSFPCPLLSQPEVRTQVYEGKCQEGSAPQWVIMTYDTTVPSSGGTPPASVVFELRSAPTEADLASAMYKPVRTATVAEPDCGIGAGAPVGCPIDLYTLLEAIPDARNPWLELKMTMTPTPDGRNGAIVHSWRLDYSCVANQ